MLALQLGGEVSNTGQGEYGKTMLDVMSPGVLLADQPTHQQVWMSHFDSITRAPEGFRRHREDVAVPVAALEHRRARVCTACSSTLR